MSEKFLTLTWQEIRDKSTTMQEKFIFAEIQQLSILEKGCIAHNEHFSTLLGVEKASVSRSISNLEKKGFITTKIHKGSRNHKRTITINKLLTPYKQFVNTPLTNCYESKETNTINNTYIEDIFNYWK